MLHWGSAIDGLATAESRALQVRRLRPTTGIATRVTGPVLSNLTPQKHTRLCRYAKYRAHAKRLASPHSRSVNIVWSKQSLGLERQREEGGPQRKTIRPGVMFCEEVQSVDNMSFACMR